MRHVSFRSILILAVVLVMASAACGSGPSQAALDRNEMPSTTTTTEPLPEGVTLVIIENGAFSPANLELDVETTWIVRWENRDEFEYVIEARRREFTSDPLPQGATFEVDFSDFDLGLYRYSTTIGNQRIPGLIDTRPAQ